MKKTTDAPPPVEMDSMQVSETPSVPPPVEYAIIVVDGGCVQDVFNGNTGVQIHYATIDYDVGELGMCSTCFDDIELKPKTWKVALRNWLLNQVNRQFGKNYYVYSNTYFWCPRCKVNWDDPPTLEEQVKIVQERWPT